MFPIWVLSFWTLLALSDKKLMLEQPVGSSQLHFKAENKWYVVLKNTTSPFFLPFAQICLANKATSCNCVHSPVL